MENTMHDITHSLFNSLLTVLLVAIKTFVNKIEALSSIYNIKTIK